MSVPPVYLDKIDNVCMSYFSEEETRCWKKSLNWVCGVEKTIEPTEDEKLELEKKHTSLEEDPFWKKFCDINVIVMMTCACFIWGFFA